MSENLRQWEQGQAQRLTEFAYLEAPSRLIARSAANDAHRTAVSQTSIGMLGEVQYSTFLAVDHVLWLALSWRLHTYYGQLETDL